MLEVDRYFMHCALAFCKNIHSSELVRDKFSAVVKEYLGYINREDTENELFLKCEIEHVDGTFNAKDCSTLLDWLKIDTGDDICRILTNARCLFEGIDVPAFDAIVFLNPRKSQTDVVQSVGRVMSRFERKKWGTILPISAPSGTPVEQAFE
ncbi:hypothetical protein O9A_00155 [Bartonella koehlerae C-29]|uniref:Helicase C-terminal domain-containing protein n=1 Tax=Bartonella koehlerae C-29 TaxID=1134510 RepID=A0A067W7G7_9HYPH|nr:hypothetical protein O9A_00155 [Bartonella koehlerae C-29]